MPKTELIAVDWKESPESVFESVKSAIEEFGLHLQKMETGDDTVIVVISDAKLNKKQLQEVAEEFDL